MHTSAHVVALALDAPTALNTLIDALSNGALYALLAIALVAVYRTTGHLNFAQGELAMVSAFLVYTGIGIGLPIWVAIAASMVISAAVAAAIQFGVVGPLERKGHSAALIAVLGLFLFANAFGGAVWGVDNKTPLAPFPADVGAKVQLVGGTEPVFLSYVTIGTWATLVALLIGLWALLTRTKLGLAYRAVVSNRASAALVGIPISAMFAVGWAIAAVPGTLSGVLTSEVTANLNFSMMINVLIYAFTAACLGGFDSLGGAVVGGLLVGVVESFVPVLVPAVGTGSGLMIALVLLLVVLLVRPVGLFGRRLVERV